MTYYAKREYVEEAVASVLASTFTDFELLVVDDASTDGGLDLIRAFGDPRIRILESAVNTGRAASANRGYEASRGEYIAVLDADDTMLPDRLAKQVRFMDGNPDVGALGTYAAIMGTNRNISFYQFTDGDCRAAFLLGDPFWYGSVMLRRSVLIDNGVRSIADWSLPGEDYLFMIELSRHTRFANLPEQLSCYRIGEQNQRHGRDPLKDRLALFSEAFRLFGIPATDEQVRLHLMLLLVFFRRPTARDVEGLRVWLDHLYSTNEALRLFPAERFKEFMESRWDKLFHYFADSGWKPALKHMRLSGSFPMDRIVYAIKVQVNALLHARTNAWTG
jgi:glycosyltransferase involved in cell wall biosynthesis